MKHQTLKQIREVTSYDDPEKMDGVRRDAKPKPSPSFTPGPWKLHGTYGEVKDEVGNGSRAIATVWTRKATNRYRDDQARQVRIVADVEGQANLRLILAAPALHAALLAVAEALGAGPHSVRATVIGQVRAALAAVEEP